MTSENFCSSLLERLKNLHTSQEYRRIASNDLLLHLKQPTTDKLNLQSINEECTSRDSSNENVISTKTDMDWLQSEVSKREHYNDCISFQEEIETFHSSGNIAKNNLRQNMLIKENIEQGESENISVSKFSYLKRGQGLFRFKAKTLKGFKKRSDEKNISQKTLFHNKSAPAHDALQTVCQQKVKQSNFEMLEQLINNDSFCSTSSKVVDLLQDESSTICSTPVSTKFPLVGTPIHNKRNNTTRRELKLINTKSPTLLISAVRSMENPPLTFQFHETPRESRNIFDSISNSSNRGLSLHKGEHTGILKKSDSNMTTPTPLRVKFHEQGVRVLEYEDDNEHSIANYSNDTDLINVSDLENLALINFHVNVVHEESVLDDEISNNNNDGKGIDTIIHDIVPVTQCSSYYNVYQNQIKETAGKSEILESIEDNLHEDDLETKSHKLLLLAKVNDLTKEIDIFKNKNKAMEQLMEELRKEKQNLVDCAKSEHENEKPLKRNYPKTKIKPVSKQVEETMSLQLQNLNKKLCSLEFENNNLRRKVINIEKREKKEIRKQGSEKLDTDPSCARVGNKVIERKSTLNNKTNQMKRSNYPCGNQINALENKDKNYPIRLIKQNVKALTLAKSKNIEDKVENFVSEESVNNNNQLGSSLKLSENSPKEGISNMAEAEHRLFTILEDSQEFSSTNSPIEDELQSLDVRKYAVEGRFLKTSISTRETQAELDNSLEIVDVYGKNVSLFQTEEENENTNVIHYPNGDKEITYPDKKVYCYAANHSTHTVYNDDGREEIEFKNGQKEIYFKDSSYQIIFPDNSSKSVYKDGSEVCVWKDGTVIRKENGETKTVHFPNGQKEIYENLSIRRVYPDGTTKILYKDGSQETKYRNGKIRFKDTDGNVTVRKGYEDV